MGYKPQACLKVASMPGKPYRKNNLTKGRGRFRWDQECLRVTCYDAGSPKMLIALPFCARRERRLV
jgi:hypothetical protein